MVLFSGTVELLSVSSFSIAGTAKSLEDMAFNDFEPLTLNFSETLPKSRAGFAGRVFGLSRKTLKRATYNFDLKQN